MFGTLQQAVVLDAPLSGNEVADATAVIEALVSGRTFSLVRAIAGPAVVEFVATQNGAVTRMGGRIPASDAAVTIEASTTVADAQLVLLHDGRRIASGIGRVRVVGPAQAGAYRVEVFLGGAGVPWLLSNPIYAGDVAPPPLPVADVPGAHAVTLAADLPWRVEKDAASSATITASPSGMNLKFGLGGGAAAGQYAALVTDVPGEDSFDRVTFIGRASRPMRLSVQLRLLGGNDRRWRRSVYLDPTPRAIAIDVSELEPTDVTSLRPTVHASGPSSSSSTRSTRRRVRAAR